MDAMTSSGKMLSQDDVDAILNESGIEGDYESKEDAPEPHEEKRPFAAKRKSADEVKRLSGHLFAAAFLEREDGVAILWNASGVMPLEAGRSLQMNGRDYVTLGVLRERHLIVGIPR